jgi:uncharacterized repeat protein (TIGR01451 family)
MFRRMLSVLASLGGGSLRKRVYVRLAAAGVLLTASILAIAHAQRSGDADQEGSGTVAKKGDTKKSADGASQGSPTSASSESTSTGSALGQPSSRALRPVPAADGSSGDHRTFAAGSTAPPTTSGYGYTRPTYGDPSVGDEPNSDDDVPPPSVDRLSQYTYGSGTDNPRVGDEAPPAYAPTYGAYGSSVRAPEENGNAAAGGVVAAGADVSGAASGTPAGSRFSLSDTAAATTAAPEASGAENPANDAATAATPGSIGASAGIIGRDATGASSIPRTAPPAVLPDVQNSGELSARGVPPGTLEREANSELSSRSNPTAVSGGGPAAAVGNAASLSGVGGGSPRPSAGVGTPQFTGNAAGLSASPAAPLAIPATPGVPNMADVKRLEGVQTPMLSLEKTAPSEVQVGREATFEIFLENVGQVTAHDVLVVDRIPAGAALVATVPPAEQLDGMLLWRLGSIAPGSETVLKITLLPQAEGEMVSVAQVTFAAQAAARTVSTKPVVTVEVEAAPQVLIGDWLKLAIIVRNDGTGAARGVVIEEDVPQELNHPAGRELENQIGLLRPGESQRLELTLSAEKMGQAVNRVRVRDDGDLNLLKETSIDVIAPRLEVGLIGPSLRYLQRQATYEVSVRNTGTATAKNVELITNLPAGLKFISADKLGQYDAGQHAVIWNLEELPPQKTGTVQLVTLPIEAGELAVMIEGHAELGAAHTTKHVTRVESLAELSFTIRDLSDPIEVGSDTMYEIEIINQGSKADSNVQLAAAFPEQLLPLKAEGPSRGVVTGQQVQFEPLARLAPRERVVFRIQAQGQIAGDPRVLVQIRSDEAPNPVSKEESTKVYTD